MRVEPNHRSEMVNQALFGEAFKILDRQSEWTQIRLGHDGYVGWILDRQIQAITHEAYRQLIDSPQALVSDAVDLIEHDSPSMTRTLVAGSPLPFYDPDQQVIQVGNEAYLFQGRTAQRLRSREELLLNAYLYSNAPYLWGGRSAFGIDCSGLTQMAYRLTGFSLLRDASQQATQGRTLDFLDEAQAGDLLFFDNEEGHITHVGIYVRENRILHASGSVRLDGLDSSGIYNAELGKHTHKLRLIKTHF
ncbi:MAG: C40 family peptidase [Schleiferiaceae bacterium]|nr:C40 family peptidase [Schleiferiaceae bacterium]